MTWNEWCFYSNGLYKGKTKEWEHTRAIAWLIYKTNSDPKKSAKNMQAWFPLATDVGYKPKTKRAKGKRLTQAKLLQFFEEMK